MLGNKHPGAGLYAHRGSFHSLQLRVLRLGLLQDGDVGVGVFPEMPRALLAVALDELLVVRVRAQLREIRARIERGEIAVSGVEGFF